MPRGTKKNNQPMMQVWDMGTDGLLSGFSDKELTPNNRAGKLKKSTPKKVSEQPAAAKDTKVKQGKKRGLVSFR